MNLLSARLTGDQEVAGFTPTFFCGDLIMKYFYRHSLPSTDSRKAGISLPVSKNKYLKGHRLFQNVLIFSEELLRSIW